ncbi:MAG TPA: rubredoxin [Burkholderiales bacterium]|nr:rubredoxin [Burkholderiales bacterium]
MPLIKAYDEIENPRIQRNLANGHFAWRSDFIKRPEDKSVDTPMAFLAEGSAHRVLRAHFHEVDQFQVMYNGAGTLGKHDVGPGAVHFSRAYTPYGPIAYSEKGLGFITLRAHRDPGAQYLPDSREVLDKVENRTPWQVTVAPDFDYLPGERGVTMKALEGLTGHHDGLAGWSVKMKPGVKAFAPDPSKGDGQYILVLKGGVQHDGKLKKDLTIIWVGKNEGPFELQAGPEGMEGLILNFPVPGGGRPEEAKVVAADADGEYKTWQCILCAFVYDEAAGMPDEGIAPGTRWADVPESFGCPDCSATKADFEMIEF